jgi:glycine/D-amino acid oxidase-like deaminating enzyme
MTISVPSGAHWRPEVGGAAIGWAEAIPEESSEPLENVPTDWAFPALALEEISKLAPFWGEVAGRLTRDGVFPSAGQYTCTPDSKPILGPSPSVEGLFFNLGYSGHGLMAAPEGSRYVVAMLTGQMSDDDNPFSYQRFARGEVIVSKEKMVI